MFIVFVFLSLDQAGINVRPYAKAILKDLSQHFEIIIFTASHGCYANVVLDYLDPKHEYIDHRLFRDNCIQTEEGVFVKDLRVLQGRNLKDIVIVDNAVYSFAYQLDNGIPIIPYYDNKDDDQLKHLLCYLKQMITQDIRMLNRQTFKFDLYTDNESP